MTIESVRSGKSLDEIESCQNEVGVVYDSLVEVHGQVIFLAKKLIFSGCWFDQQVCFKNSRARRRAVAYKKLEESQQFQIF